MGGGHGQGVDDAGPRQLVQVLGQPAEPLLRGGQLHHAQAQAFPVQRAAQHQRLAVGPAGQLLGHVPGDPRVGRRRGGEHRHAGRQVLQHRAEPPVIRPEVMPPVGDAVRLVHDQHARGGGELGQDEVAEARVVQPLRADQQQVHGACGDLRVDLVPVRHVGRVHGPGLQPGPGRRLDLVAHQREQRGDDDGRPHVPGPEQRGRDEVHGRLAPAGALHDQGPAPVAGQRLDRGPLILAELGGRPGQRAQAALRLLAQGGLGNQQTGVGNHESLVSGASDSRGPARPPPGRHPSRGVRPVRTGQALRASHPSCCGILGGRHRMFGDVGERGRAAAQRHGGFGGQLWR